jgi:hypothetical protein
MKLPNGTRAKVNWFTDGNPAIILQWDGIPTGDIGLRGTKMAVAAWVIDFAFAEHLVKPEFAKAFVEKCLDKRLLTKEDLKSYG